MKRLLTAAAALAGQAAEQAGTRKNGVEITVRLDNGSVVAITQEADETTFAPRPRAHAFRRRRLTRSALSAGAPQPVITVPA